MQSFKVFFVFNLLCLAKLFAADADESGDFLYGQVSVTGIDMIFQLLPSSDCSTNCEKTHFKLAHTYNFLISEANTSAFTVRLDTVFTYRNLVVRKFNPIGQNQYTEGADATCNATILGAENLQYSMIHRICQDGAEYVQVMYEQSLTQDNQDKIVEKLQQFSALKKIKIDFENADAINMLATDKGPEDTSSSLSSGE